MNDNLYFVVQLKDTIRHFFLPGWFGDMDAPVTAVAMLSKTATSSSAANDDNTSLMPSLDSMGGRQSESPLPTMPSMPDNPREKDGNSGILANNFKNNHVIIHNWEVQNAYRSATNNVVLNGSTGLTAYGARFEGSEFYTSAWNHFQDFYNRYAAGALYRTQTVTILDDVKDVNNDGTVDLYGEISSVAGTAANINTNKNSPAYNPKVNARATYRQEITQVQDIGLPYVQERLDSINVDFGPEIRLKSGSKWLTQDWDITLGYDGSIDVGNYADANKNAKNLGAWANIDTLEAFIRVLRIHTSINFDGNYKVRPGKDAPDILYARIESEPMLRYPDRINSGADSEQKLPEQVTAPKRRHIMVSVFLIPSIR